MIKTNEFLAQSFQLHHLHLISGSSPCAVYFVSSCTQDIVFTHSVDLEECTWSCIQALVATFRSQVFSTGVEGHGLDCDKG